MDNEKNFSESKASSSDKLCKLCQEPVPQITIYQLNKIATQQGFCSWSCLISGMNSTTIAALIKAEREKEK